MSYTLDENGLALTETQEGVTMPADYTFALVNDFVHSAGTQFEELQYLCLGMSNEIEKLRGRESTCITDDGEDGSGKDLTKGTWFQSAVSGLWYLKPEAAGSVRVVLVNGRSYFKDGA